MFVDGSDTTDVGCAGEGEMETLYCRDASEWRRWLEAHGEETAEIWLIYLKKGADGPCVTYPDSLDEALCRGWIDGRIKRIDDTRYVRRFTPRTETSRWSAANIRRMDELIGAGRVAEGALSEFRRALEEDRVVRQPKNPTLPDELLSDLKGDEEAFALFEKLSPSHRRQYVLWITDAKRPETRLRRVRRTKAMLRAGERPGI